EFHHVFFFLEPLARDARASRRGGVAMNPVDLLKELRAQSGEVRTRGLSESMPGFPELGEQAQIESAQSGFVNFYADDAVCPFVALAARGPWIVTTKGAVLYDCGGYGMLGFGHNPAAVLQTLSRRQVMANVMTPNVSQFRFAEALRREIGHTRGTHPYRHFMCLNSGSESVTLACRVADVNAKLMTDAGGRYAGRTIKRLVVKGAFHGRTEKPALYSDSSRKT